MRRILSGLVAATLWCALGSSASAEMISLFPVSDRAAEDRLTFATGALRDDLFDALLDDPDPYLRTYNDSNIMWEIRSALVFDVSSIPSDAQITSAVLFLQTNALVRAEFGETRLIVDGYSAQSAVQLNDFSAFNPVGSADLPNPRALPLLTVDTTSFLQSFQELDASFAGFTLRTVPGATIHVASREWFMLDSRPRLDVQFDTVKVPEPPMLALGGIGAVFGVLSYVFHRLLCRLRVAK